MIRNVSQILLSSTNFYMRTVPKRTCRTLAYGYKHGSDQIQYLKSIINENDEVIDWPRIKSKVLAIPGTVNTKNIDAVFLKVLINEKKLNIAQSFAEHLLSFRRELNLGATNGMLNLYVELNKINKLSDEGKKFIIDTFKCIYYKYQVPDSTTCERLLHALCAINEWHKAMKVLDDINTTCTPTHSAYSTLIATLFKGNKKTMAYKLIENSISVQRPLLDIAYEEWINFIFREHKDKKSNTKYLDELCSHLSRNFIVIPEKAAEKLMGAYEKIGWNANITKFKKINGQCLNCSGTLDCLKLSDNEFQLLQSTIKDKLIVGSDLFLKTSPDELKRFMTFVEQTAPYDIVLDALNISYAVGKYNNDKIGLLTYVIEHFQDRNMKILLLGRKHMLKWPGMKFLLSRTCNFFTDNLSQDDPFFITAALLSGSHTHFVSRDLLRGHRFKMQDVQLIHLFQRWQWQHQWKVFITGFGQPRIQPPLSVTPCAQKNGSTWHLPFEKADAAVLSMGQIKDGTPDWASWLCLQPPLR